MSKLTSGLGSMFTAVPKAMFSMSPMASALGNPFDKKKKKKPAAKSAYEGQVVKPAGMYGTS